MSGVYDSARYSNVGMSGRERREGGREEETRLASTRDFQQRNSNEQDRVTGAFRERRAIRMISRRGFRRGRGFDDKIGRVAFQPARDAVSLARCRPRSSRSVENHSTNYI